MKKPEVSIIGSDDIPRELVQLAFDGVHATYCRSSNNIDITVVNHQRPAEITAEALNHEYLHYILHKEVGETACIELDNIDRKFNPLIEF